MRSGRRLIRRLVLQGEKDARTNVLRERAWNTNTKNFDGPNTTTIYRRISSQAGADLVSSTSLIALSAAMEESPLVAGWRSEPSRA